MDIKNAYVIIHEGGSEYRITIKELINLVFNTPFNKLDIPCEVSTFGEKFNMEKEIERWFFDRDDNAHWYMIPEGLRKQWIELSKDTSDEGYDKFNEVFEQYRTGGGINYISFANPKEE